MPVPLSSQPRVSVDGKFFRLADRKFHAKGLAYGPFVPNAAGEPFPAREQAARDFDQIRGFGANLIRIYELPPRWFLNLAAENGLKVFVDVPWAKHQCFLDSAAHRERARAAVAEGARLCAKHPAVFALSVVNEIPADIVRWSGPKAVAEFIDELVDVAKAEDPDLLCTFANYPPTEFLRPQNVDFLTFNVYLHPPKPFESYLARLQMIADSKPLLLGEFGMDSIREGEPKKSECLRWQIEAAFRGGLAGVIVFGFSDDWHTDGRAIEDWAFGITTRDRQPKESAAAVRELFQAAPYFPLPRTPRVSVVVASYNGAHTLKACLGSLERLNYPNFEIILVDDGSTDDTQQIATLHKGIRNIRHPQNLGLSVARNTGISAARGEIVAFTDSDCRADEDWLHYLVGDLLNSDFAGIGGHNFLPPEDSWVAAAVMVSPGGPAHVMLTDRMAEHIPGCNMAFYKWALDEVGGFDPIFHAAGDDVDVCWRLQQHGHKIGFSPAGFVWHYRRSTVAAYLRQQRGYGAAEALLVRKHPEYFNAIGGSLWQGRIYSPAKPGVVTRQDMIYHGTFASGFFQSIYSGSPNHAPTLLTSLEYHVCVTLPLLTIGAAFAGVKFHLLMPLGITSLFISLALCIAAAWQAELPRKKRRARSRPLIATMFFLQPIVRGWARYAERLTLRHTPLAAHETLDSLTLKRSRSSLGEVGYWCETGVDRMEFLRCVIERLAAQGWQNKTDSGWSRFDVEVSGSRWCWLQLTTATELHARGRRLLRCRLRTGWSLLAHVTFWTALGFEILLISALGSSLWWLAFLLIALPALVWLFREEQLALKRIISVLLDGVAKGMAIAKVERVQPADSVHAVQPAASAAGVETSAAHGSPDSKRPAPSTRAATQPDPLPRRS
ncbi:MAG: glycosyltransferase [Verrucomicrobia bacterium]|nr:glycosyltransferase [Verrucomicrobiota bacterium]